MPDGYSTDHRDVNTYRGARTNSSVAPDPEAPRHSYRSTPTNKK